MSTVTGAKELKDAHTWVHPEILVDAHGPSSTQGKAFPFVEALH